MPTDKKLAPDRIYIYNSSVGNDTAYPTFRKFHTTELPSDIEYIRKAIADKEKQEAVIQAIQVERQRIVEIIDES